MWGLLRVLWLRFYGAAKIEKVKRKFLLQSEEVTIQHERETKLKCELCLMYSIQTFKIQLNYTWMIFFYLTSVLNNILFIFITDKN